MRCVSIVIIPRLAPVWMSELMRKVLFSRIREAIELVLTMISYPATRPPPIFLQRTWEMTATSDEASCVRIMSFMLAGNASTMRSTVLAAPFV